MYRYIEESFSRQSFLRRIGARLISLESGKAVVEAELTAELLQQHGAGHAGVSFTLGDVAAGYAALTVMPPGREVMTSEMKIHLLRPALGERLIARGEVLKPGRRLVITKADVFAVAAGEEVMVATLLGTMVPVDP